MTATRAQSFLEYAIVISCMVAAILGLQIFLKRTMQGRFREAADQIGGQYAPQQSELTINTVVDPISISTNPAPVWLKYPPGTIDKYGNNIGGDYIVDSYDLPVFGIDTSTTYSETVQKEGKEEMDRFETDLF